MNEVWKDIPGYEGIYEISNLGNVKSHFGKEERILVTNPCSSGYLKVVLCRDKHHKNVMIHRLVAEAFISNPYNERTVNHKDGNKKNNAVTNLEWCSYSNNQKHAYRTGLNKWNPKKGKKQIPVIKMDLHTHEVIGEYESIGEAFRSIEEYKDKPTRYDAISRCCKGILKSAHGYFWKFKESEV